MNTNFQNIEAREFDTFDATINLVRGNSNVIGMGHDKFSAVENALFGIKLAALTQEDYKTEREELLEELETAEMFEDPCETGVYFVDITEDDNS